MEDRHIKVATLLTELAAKFVRNEANSDPLITVTRSNVSKDYKNATVFFTTIPAEREADALVFLKRSGGEMRRFVMKHMRIKHIPHIDFMIDYGERHRQHTDEVFTEMEKAKNLSIRNSEE